MKSLFVIRYFGHRPTSLWLALFLIISLSLGILILPNLAHAQILPACTATGNCGICDFLDTFTNIIRWLLGIVGGSALLLMVWHGFGWITSGGNKEKVDSARKGMLHTVIGIIIILGAWQVINLVIVMLVNDPGSTTKFSLFKDNTEAWYQYCGVGEDKICQGRGNGSPCGNGRFCWENNCASSAKLSTDKQVTNACEFWANYPDTAKMGGFNPYSGYKCLLEKCDPYENLGTAYCKNSEGSCCKELNADTPPATPPPAGQ